MALDFPKRRSPAQQAYEDFPAELRHVPAEGGGNDGTNTDYTLVIDGHPPVRLKQRPRNGDYVFSNNEWWAIHKCEAFVSASPHVSSGNRFLAGTDRAVPEYQVEKERLRNMFAALVGVVRLMGVSRALRHAVIRAFYARSHDDGLANRGLCGKTKPSHPNGGDSLALSVLRALWKQYALLDGGNWVDDGKRVQPGDKLVPLNVEMRRKIDRLETSFGVYSTLGFFCCDGSSAVRHPGVLRPLNFNERTLLSVFSVEQRAMHRLTVAALYRMFGDTIWTWGRCQEMFQELVYGGAANGFELNDLDALLREIAYRKDDDLAVVWARFPWKYDPNKYPVAPNRAGVGMKSWPFYHATAVVDMFKQLEGITGKPIVLFTSAQREEHRRALWQAKIGFPRPRPPPDVYALLLSGILCRWIPASEIDDALTELLRLDPGGPDWRNLDHGLIAMGFIFRWNDPGVPELFKKVGNLAPNDKLLLLAAWRAAAPIPGVMHHLCTLFAWMPRPSQLCTSGPMEWCKDAYSLCYRDFTKSVKAWKKKHGDQPIPNSFFDELLIARWPNVDEPQPGRKRGGSHEDGGRAPQRSRLDEGGPAV